MRFFDYRKEVSWSSKPAVNLTIDLAIIGSKNRDWADEGSKAHPDQFIMNNCTGCLEKSLPEKSWIKSAVLCVLISFLLEFISRLGEVSGEGFSQIDSLYQFWWDFKEMCKKTTKIGNAGSGPLCGGTDRWRSRRFPGDSNLEFDNC